MSRQKPTALEDLCLSRKRPTALENTQAKIVHENFTAIIYKLSMVHTIDYCLESPNVHSGQIRPMPHGLAWPMSLGLAGPMPLGLAGPMLLGLAGPNVAVKQEFLRNCTHRDFMLGIASH